MISPAIHIDVYGDRGERVPWNLAFSRDETDIDTWTITVSDSAGKTIGSAALLFSAGVIADESRELVFTDSDAGVEVIFDFSTGVTSFSSGSVSSLRVSAADGHGTGAIATLVINDSGAVEITYTNEEKRILGSVALADFRDPQSLEQRSRALFAFTELGQRQLLAATDERVGSILGNRLEASNVDLGNQFGDLILIQRGFQASSQILRPRVRGNIHNALARATEAGAQHSYRQRVRARPDPIATSSGREGRRRHCVSSR